MSHSGMSASPEGSITQVIASRSPVAIIFSAISSPYRSMTCRQVTIRAPSSVLGGRA